MTVVLDSSFKFCWILDLQLSIPVENRVKQYTIRLAVGEMSRYSETIKAVLHGVKSSTTKAKRLKLFNYDVCTDDSNKLTKFDSHVELDAYSDDSMRTKFSVHCFHSQLKILKKLIVHLF